MAILPAAREVFVLSEFYEWINGRFGNTSIATSNVAQVAEPIQIGQPIRFFREMPRMTVFVTIVPNSRFNWDAVKRKIEWFVDKSAFIVGARPVDDAVVIELEVRKWLVRV